MACRSEVVTDEGAFHKFISIAALHTATEHLACPLTLSLRQATSQYLSDSNSIPGYQTNQDQSMVNAGGFCRSLDSSHGEEISEQTTLAVKGL